MGASFLSRPIKTKISDDESNERLSYGVSCMQGWRLKQEDAHNCILEYDKDISLFAVYDGHGGSEVAVYTSNEFPSFLRNTEKYKEGLYKEALIEAFLGFDDTIATAEVLSQLTKLMEAEKEEQTEEAEINSDAMYLKRAAECSLKGCSGSSSSSSSSNIGSSSSSGGSGSSRSNNDNELDDDEDFISLRRDANRPLNEVMASYCVPKLTKLINEGRNLKPGSPYLRARRDTACKSSVASSSNFTGECSSSFVNSSDDTNVYGCSSSPASSETNGTNFEKNLTDINTSGCSSTSVSTEINDPSENNLKQPKFITDEVINGDAPESSFSKCDISLSTISNASKTESNAEKYSKQELTNGPSSESLVNGSTNSSVNGELDEDFNVEKRTKRIRKETTSTTLSCKPSTSPKKKKLALTDLENSDVVKNFITNDDIDESDDDDSEDETFQLLKEDLDSDDDNDDDDDDEEEEEEDDDEDDEEDDITNSSKSSELNEDDDEDEEEEEEDDGESESDEEDDEYCNYNLFSDPSEIPGVDSGCTAVVALIKNDDLYVANAGDSRCIICKAGNAVEMSEDHKPEDTPERERIIKAGGTVTGVGRVNGGLNLSRAIGDHSYKKNSDLPNTEQMITALPDVKIMKLDSDVEFIVLACDGIWNSMTSQEVVNFVRPKIQANQKLSSICEEMFEKCLAPDTYGDGTGCDNMTCIIIKLPNHLSSGSDMLNNSETKSVPVFDTITKSTTTGETCLLQETSVKNSRSEDEKQLNEQKDVDENCIISEITDFQSQKRTIDLTEENIACKRKKTDDENIKYNVTEDPVKEVF